MYIKIAFPLLQNPMQLQNTGMPRIISVCIQRVLRAQCNSLAFRPRAPCNQAEMCMNHAAAWGQFFFSSAAPTSGGWKLLRWDVYTLVEITQLWRHRHWWKLHRCDVIQTIGITKMWRHPHWWKLHSWVVIHNGGNYTALTSSTLVEIAQMGH